LGKYLEKRGVTLKVGDEFLAADKAGGFVARGDTAEIILKSDPTKYEVWHELGHFIQWKGIGPEAYRSLPRSLSYNAPEQFVFDLLENYQRRWGLLNSEEQQAAIRYIERIGGFR
jgi:Metallopeptidase toxin 4